MWRRFSKLSKSNWRQGGIWIAVASELVSRFFTARGISAFFAFVAVSLSVPVFGQSGFWHIERQDGRDWAIDPDGRKTVLAGVDWVWPYGFHCEKLGYSPYGRFVETNYPSREVWADETASRLKKWGFNFLGSGCDDKLLAPRGFAHTAMLNVGYSLSHEADKEKAISPGLHRPGSAFPNVFHPGFEAAWDRAAASAAARYRNERNLLGYYLDNELSWGGISRNRDEGMFDAAASYPDSHSAKKALLDFLKEKGMDVSRELSSVPREIKVEFLARVAERYFSVAAGAVRRHDPNHMVLGCRFAGLGAHDVVLKAAAKHCDIVTFNYYPWADLDRGIVLDRINGRPIADVFREFHAKVGAPLLITEWSFSALDTGRPCSDGAGQRFRTQAERVEAAEMFARTLLSLPFMVGHAWFMWVDQPALGFNKYFHEDCNYGLVNESGKPYPALTKMFARLHADGVKLRTVPLAVRKVAKKAKREVRLSERERFMRKAKRAAAKHSRKAAKKASFTNDGTAWQLSNESGLRLSGRIGSSSLVDELERDYRIVGRLGARIMTTAPDWPPVTRLSSAEGGVDPKTGLAYVVLEGTAGGKSPFAVSVRLTLSPYDTDILAEILSVKNTGDNPLEIMKVFLCPVAGDEIPPERVPMPVNVWKGWNESHWKLFDGARYGAISYDESADGFNLWTEANGAQHADIPFRPKTSPVTLQPGEKLAAVRPMGARLVLSTDKR